MRVLVVEDDADLRETLVDELRFAGHEVRGACDGLDAWNLLHDGAPSPDVVLLDLMMPNLDGHQFRIRQLAEPCLATIPTIVFTAVHVDAPMRQALGEVLVLSKPAGLGPLIAAVAEAAEPRGHVTKRCDCGLVYDSGSWRALPIVREIDNGRDVGERIELRNCTCESILAW